MGKDIKAAIWLSIIALIWMVDWKIILYIGLFIVMIASFLTLCHLTWEHIRDRLKLTPEDKKTLREEKNAKM